MQVQLEQLQTQKFLLNGSSK